MQSNVPVSNTRFRVPKGFNLLLEGLTREILREQPENMAKFAAEYFQSLVDRRGINSLLWKKSGLLTVAEVENAL